MEQAFNYTGLSDFIERTQVVESIPGGEAVIIVCWLDPLIPITLPGFKTDKSKTDFEIKEQGYLYWLKLEELTQAKRAVIPYTYSKESDPLKDADLTMMGKNVHLIPLTPSACFKIRQCPNCNQMTAQEQKPYNPDDDGESSSFMVWCCTMCKENIDIV